MKKGKKGNLVSKRHKISIRSNPSNSKQSFIIEQSSKNRTSRERAVHRGRPLWRGGWRENMATTRAKFRNARDTISSWWRARKFPQTIANLPLNTERTDHDSRGHSIEFDWRRINGCRGMVCFFQPFRVPDSTNRNLVLRK